MKKVGVTGFSGFIGSRIMSYPHLQFEAIPLQLRGVVVSELNLTGYDAIIHLAGKAHDMSNPEASEYFNTNTELTREFAVSAKKQGVAHFIYFSSVKVYDDSSGEYFNELSACKPEDAYGESKYEAEKLLRELETGEFKVAIVRPPLVYGPGVKANMLSLIKLSNRNIPLPFANTCNSRSMVYIDNLVELVNRIIQLQASGIFIAGDPEPLSTGQLVFLIRNGLGKKAGLFNVPAFFKSVIKKYKPMLYKRLYGSFVIDNKGTNKTLDFKVPYQTEAGINAMIKWYLKQGHGN